MSEPKKNTSAVDLFDFDCRYVAESRCFDRQQKFRGVAGHAAERRS